MPQRGNASRWMSTPGVTNHRSGFYFTRCCLLGWCLQQESRSSSQAHFATLAALSDHSAGGVAFGSGGYDALMQSESKTGPRFLRHGAGVPGQHLEGDRVWRTGRDESEKWIHFLIWSKPGCGGGNGTLPW
jgi:hypothetical protein